MTVRIYGQVDSRESWVILPIPTRAPPPRAGSSHGRGAVDSRRWPHRERIMARVPGVATRRLSGEGIWERAWFWLWYQTRRRSRRPRF